MEKFKLIYDLYLFNSIGRSKFRLGHIFIIKYEVCVILGIIGPFRVVDRVVAVVPPPNQRQGLGRRMVAEGRGVATPRPPSRSACGERAQQKAARVGGLGEDSTWCCPYL
jgi:hypothetical protein